MNLLSEDGKRYTALMDGKFKMSGVIKVEDGIVFLKQDREHGKGFPDEVEQYYNWCVDDGSEVILDFMGITNFKIIE